MVELEWAHAIAAILGAIGGASAGIFAAGRWVGKIEPRLKLHVQNAVIEGEKRIEDKVDEARESFDETLRALRQKINDVELDTEKRFLPKGEFNDFREEYREDMRDLKNLIAQNQTRK